MDDRTNAIAALERVLLTVEAELTALHTGEAVDRVQLEGRLLGDLSASGMQPATPPPPPPPMRPAPPAPSGPPVMSTSSRPMHSPIDVERILRLGGISLVVLAAVFFVSTAISRGWIGPAAQLALAAATSLGMIAQSFRFSNDRRPWKITMAIGGAAALFASGVVGHFGLDLLDINVTMVWLGVTIGGFLALGRAHDAQSIAAAGAPAAIVGTLLFEAAGLSTGPVLLGLASLWAVAVLAATWDQRWFGARAAGGATASLIVVLGATIDTVTTTIELGVSVAIATILALVCSQTVEYGRVADDAEISMLAHVEARIAATFTPWATFAIALLIAGGTNLFDATEVIGWFAVAAGLGVAAFVTALSAGTRRLIHPTLAMLHQLAGLGTAAVGFIAVLDGPVLIAALLGQAVITAALAIRGSSPEMFAGATLLAIVPSSWTLWKLFSAIGGTSMSLGDVVVTGLVVLAVGVGAFMVKDRPQREHAWVGGWALYLFWIAAAFQQLPQAQMVISLAWAASAVLLIVTRTTLWGSAGSARLRSVINVALATLLITGAKLVFVDLVFVDVLWRAALFLVIGSTFLRLAFVLPDMINTNLEDDALQPPEKMVV